MRAITLAVLCSVSLGPILRAQTIVAPYNSSYSFRSLGPPPGVPAPLGGVTFKHDDKDVLLIGGSAN